MWSRCCFLWVAWVEEPGLYKYYSTQRPVDIGTFPKPSHNDPDEIINYDQRVPVENCCW